MSSEKRPRSQRLTKPPLPPRQNRVPSPVDVLSIEVPGSQRSSVVFPHGDENRLDSDDTLNPIHPSGLPTLSPPPQSPRPAPLPRPHQIARHENTSLKFGSAVNLQYELPELVGSLQAGWTEIAHVAAVVSSAFAICAILLMFQAETLRPQAPHLHDILFVFAYSSILFNFASAFSSILVTQKLGGIPLQSSKEGSNPPRTGWYSRSSKLLERFGVGQSWSWIIWYWILSFHSGLVCLMVQLGLQVWLQDRALAGKIVIIVMFGIVSLPIGLFMVASLWRNSRRTAPQVFV